MLGLGALREPGFATTPQKIQAIVVEPQEESEFVSGTIPLRVGMDWREAYLGLSERFLRTSDRYSAVQVRWDTEKSVLLVQVEPYRFFESIRYSKDKPRSESEVRNFCIRKQEEVKLTQERISQISNCVIERIRADGFLDAQAFVFPEGSDLVIEINRGELYRLESVELLGAKNLNPKFLLNSLKNKEGNPFRPMEVINDTRELNDQYFKAGFLQSRVFEPSIQVVPATRRVSITWRVREGDRYRIKFEGDYSSRKPLNRIRDSAEPAPDWFLDEIQEEIRQSLADRGFLDAVATRSSRRLAGHILEVTFESTKGRQYWLSNPLFVGLQNKEAIEKIYLKVSSLKPGRFFSEKEYRKVFEEQFFVALVESGFQEVKIRSLEFVIDRERYLVQPVIYMQEGARRMIENFELKGLPPEMSGLTTLEDLRDEVRKGRPYNAIAVNEALKALTTELRGQGYLDVVSEVDWDSKRSILIVRLKAGPRYRIGDSIVRGIRRTQLAVIRNQFKFQTGDFYSQEEINNTTAEILRLGLARSIDIQVFDKDTDQGVAVLLVEIVEAARFRFELGPGYGTVDGLRGVFRGTYANIGGTGRRLSAYAKASRRLESKELPDDVIGVDGSGNVTEPAQVKRVPFLERRVTLEYFEPNFLIKEIDGRVVLRHELLSRRQFGVENYSSTGLLDWRPLSFLTYTPSFKIEYSDPFNIQLADETRQVDDTGPSRLHSIGQVLLLNLVDDAFNPTKGFRFQTSNEIYSKFFGGDDSFWLVNLEQTFYWPIVELVSRRKVGFAVSLNSGFSSEFGSSLAVPVEKRFRIGGESSVRGFGEDAIQPLDKNGDPLRNGGRSVFFFRSELNFPLVGWIDLLGFFDGGSLYPRNSEFAPWDLDSLRYGSGFGVRLNTPVGPIKAGYAFVINRKPGEDMGQVYFGVGPL